MTSRRIKGILFDLGDTLLDFGPFDGPKLFKAGGKLAYQRLRQLNQPLPTFRRYFRRQLRAVRWRHVLGHLTGKEFNSLDLISRISREFGQHLTDEQFLELAWLWYEPLRRRATMEAGLGEMLAALRDAGLTLGIVSNTFVPGEVLDRHLEQEDLLRHLPIRVYSCEVGYRKPRREVFAAALRRGALQADETMFVGDKVRADVRGAGRLGMITVLKDPFGRYDHRNTGADHRIRSLLELPGIVAQYNGS